jgi:hypothetical protein
MRTPKVKLSSSKHGYADVAIDLVTRDMVQTFASPHPARHLPMTDRYGYGIRFGGVGENKFPLGMRARKARVTAKQQPRRRSNNNCENNGNRYDGV